MGDKVLAVDDELQMRDLLNLFLTRDGYDVLLASNGEDAIELAKKENPQIILLDIKMPGINGIEVCRRLKADRKTQSIPIIVISALVLSCINQSNTSLGLQGVLLSFSIRMERLACCRLR